MRAGTIAGVVLLAACGGAEPAEPVAEAAPPTETAATAGDETPVAEPEPMRVTTPIPVPQPAVDRDSLSTPLQTLWDRIELAVAVRPPEPPAEATTDAITAWANGPFGEFLARRRDAVARAEAAITGVRGMSAIERGVAAALLGYVYEDGAAAIRGAPVPESIASDPEMLEVYTTTIDEVVAPIARAS